MCHRRLTDPKSISEGLGPACARKIYGGKQYRLFAPTLGTNRERKQ